LKFELSWTAVVWAKVLFIYLLFLYRVSVSIRIMRNPEVPINNPRITLKVKLQNCAYFNSIIVQFLSYPQEHLPTTEPIQPFAS